MLHTDHVFHELKPFTVKELSKIYKICTKTFKKWIKPYDHDIGKRHGRFYTVRQVKIIFKSIGYPSSFYDDGD